MAKGIMCALTTEEKEAMLLQLQSQSDAGDDRFTAFGREVSRAISEGAVSSAAGVAQAAVKELGWGRKVLANKVQTTLRGKLWQTGETKMTRASSSGGRRRKVDDPQVTKIVKQFLVANSRETSRIAQTKLRHMEAVFPQK